MVVESEGLAKRNVASRTLETLTGPGRSMDERLGAGVRVVAVTGPVAIIGEQVAVHGGSALAALGSAVEPGLVGGAIAVPAAVIVSLALRGVEAGHDRQAQLWPTLEYLYHDADKAAAIRSRSAKTFRLIAGGSLVAAGTAAVAAAALAVGPAIGLGHVGMSAHDLAGAAEVLGAGGTTAAVVARHWNQRVGARAPRSLTE